MSESCGTLSRFNESASFCNWRATSHDVQGDLLTDTTVPVLARVSASWEFTGGSKSAQIELDDVPIPGGVWQRQGTEPDPLLFRIRAGSNQGNRLVLSVQLVSGDTVKIPMALLAFGGASTRNYFTDPTSFRDPGPWHIAAERTATAHGFVHPPFRTLSIAGHTSPTNVRVNRFSDSRLEEYLTVNDIALFDFALYRQRWIDDAEVFNMAPPGGPVVLRQVLTERLLTMPVGPLPVVLMEAQMERVYEPAELEFLKTFVTSEPPTQTFTIVGRRPGD